MQTHANEAMHDGGSRGWSPWCTCIVVITCCSGSASTHIPLFCNHGVWVAKGLSREPQNNHFFFDDILHMVPAILFWNSEGLSQEPYRDDCHGLRFIWRYLFDGIYGRDCLLGVPSIGRLIHLGLLFSWLICTFKDSVPDGLLKRSNFV